jgi:Ca2+-binding RTX toxin-like protein
VPMYVSIFNNDRLWYLPILVPVPAGEPLDPRNDWEAEDGITKVFGDGYSIDLGYSNTYVLFEQAYNKNILDIMSPDGGILNVRVQFFGQGGFAYKGTGVVETVYGSPGNDIFYDNSLALTPPYEQPDYTFDRYFGGGGNDTYFITSVKTYISEGTEPYEGPTTTGGIDTVVVNFGGYVLGSGLERLRMIGTLNEVDGEDATSAGTGNELDNVLYGDEWKNELWAGPGVDVIFGGNGADQMDGGDGADIFVIQNEGSAISGQDSIFGFDKTDLIVSDQKLFDRDGDGYINTGGNKRFDFEAGASISISGEDGKAVKKLEFDGEIVVNDETYYVYSLRGGSGELAHAINYLDSLI